MAYALKRAFAIVTFAALGLGAGMIITGRMHTAETSAEAQHAMPEAPAPSGPEIQAPRGVAAPAGALPDLTTVAQRAIDSVTNISSTQIVRAPSSPFANDPFFRYFFGDDPYNYRERRAQSLGSGVVVSADGYVLTNNHVVTGGSDEPVRIQDVSVVLSDKREVRAKIVGVDPDTDMALLKINATNLHVLPWGDSSKLKIAEWVLAIGNPFQLNQTVTLGIVSATGRSLEGRLATYEDFIQTDAAINPGNSGGALINQRGELVGINTAIYSGSGGYQGIGFAVPSNLARHVMDDIIKYGQVRRGTITGIQLQPLTSQIAEQLGADSTRGVLIVRIDPRSDAFVEGMRAGDIIVSFNGTPVDGASHFMRLLSDAEIGSTVALTALRDGRQRTFKVPIVQQSGARKRRQAF
jgi:Do/DeqQ family serine protease